jgi:hypothetical protein
VTDGLEVEAGPIETLLAFASAKLEPPPPPPPLFSVVPVEASVPFAAGLSVAMGDPRRGVCIFGAEAAARGDKTTWFSIHVFGLRSDRSEEDLLLAHSMLNDSTFAACWSDGRAMTLDQAIAYALEAVPAVA